MTKDEDRRLIEKRNEYLRAKLEKLKKGKKELEEVWERLKDTGKTETSLTDPESRLMKNNGRVEVCYNAEMSVDAKGHVVVDYEVTNEANDEKQLAPCQRAPRTSSGSRSSTLRPILGSRTWPRSRTASTTG